MIGSLFVVGPAGTGKSTFSGSLRDYLTLNNFDAAVVNLDPGAEFLPYDPDFDIRDYISLDSIMSEYNLGPNGAQIVAADLIINEAEKIKEYIESLDDYYVIFDTPGQMELFTFRPSSTETVKRISGDSSMIAFVADGLLSTSPSGYISQKMLYGSVFSRFYRPMLFVLNKIDLVQEEDVRNVKKWEDSVDLLNEAFMDEKGEMEKDYFIGILQAFQASNMITKIFPVSSKDSFGFEDVYAQMSMFFSGGEDTDLYKEE